jgi:DNA-binding LytR/AlgR family response regulator
VPVSRSGNGHQPFQLTDAPDALPAGNGASHSGIDGLGMQPLSRLAVKLDHKFLFVNLADVRWIEARGNYVRLHAPDAMYDLRVSLGALVRRLDSNLFVRVHRSAVANISAIVEVDPRLSGRHVIVLCDGTRITTSRSYRNEMRRLLHNSR